MSDDPLGDPFAVIDEHLARRHAPPDNPWFDAPDRRRDEDPNRLCGACNPPRPVRDCSARHRLNARSEDHT